MVHSVFSEALYFGHFLSFCTLQLEPPKYIMGFDTIPSAIHHVLSPEEREADGMSMLLVPLIAEVVEMLHAGAQGIGTV